MVNKFKAIADDLRRRLADGEFSDAVAFPSETSLVRRYGVTRATVRRALARLVDEGLIHRHQGAGSRLTPHGCLASGKIGLLFPDRSCIDVFASMVCEILRVGGRTGYSFAFREITGATSKARAEETLDAVEDFVRQRVEGVIFRPLVSEACEDVNIAVLDRLRVEKTPVVLVDGGVTERKDYDVVGVDNIAAGRQIGDYLISLGHKRIAFLLNSLPIGPTGNLRDRMFGVAGAATAAGLSWTAQNVIPCADYDVEALRRYFLRCRKVRPDAIVCGSDNVAQSLIRSLVALGYSVPKDLSVVGFDDAPYAARSEPGLTTVRQDFARIGAVAFERLRQRILNPRLEVCALHLPVELVVRGTTATRASMRRKGPLS